MKVILLVLQKYSIISLKNDILTFLRQEELDIKTSSLFIIINYILHIFTHSASVRKLNVLRLYFCDHHPRSKGFIEFIKKKFNPTIEVISGEREAYLTAVGFNIRCFRC